MDIISFRPAIDRDFRRSINDVPLVEIAGLLRDNSALLETDEPVYALAHAMGYNRVAMAIRSRLEKAIVTISHALNQLNLGLLFTASYI